MSSLASSFRFAAAVTALAALGAAFAAPLPATAQSVFGDTSLAYRDGVVYDDDTVPGAGLNQPFIFQPGVSTSPSLERRVSSPDLIAEREAIRRSERDALQRNVTARQTIQ